ncbi:MAG: hypothetical protein NC120_06825 [Ruminococcus sp.]|nr:hypothetical protein [Ruminococcus sp.]
MEIFMIAWAIVQIAAIVVTVWLLTKLHKPKDEQFQEYLKNNKNEKEKKL